MNFQEYQERSARTASKHDYELANYGLGISGEAGEVAELIKKAVFHGHSIDKENVKKELGDVLWYLSQIATIAGLSIEEIAEANIEKLKKRYPKGFNTTDSIKRVDAK